MNQVTLLHDQAIDSLDAALVAEKRRDEVLAKQLRLKAFELERSAAGLLATETESEPSRSVLFRSAASIALQCGLLEDAEHLIYQGLAGAPPKTIANELKNLLEDVTFRRHLSVNGVFLNNDEVQVSIAGAGIGYGVAPVGSIVERLNAANLLLFRTAERRMNRPYRDAGPPTNQVREIAQAFISVPRAASFAFSLRVGGNEQTSFDGLGSSEQIVDDFLDCMELFEKGDREELSKRIPDTSYLNNFLGLAASVAPDGQVVNTVGFTAVRAGRTREVALRNTAQDIQAKLSPTPLLTLAQIQVDVEGIPVRREFSGLLKFADSTHDTDMIKLVGEKEHEIVVPPGLMNDIVRPRWNTYVTVEAVRQGSKWVLEAIRLGITSVASKDN